MTSLFVLPRSKPTDIFHKLPWDFREKLPSATQDDYPESGEDQDIFVWWKVTDVEERDMILSPSAASVTGTSTAFSYVTTEKTSALTQDTALRVLKTASDSGDERLFVQIVNTINWDRRSSEDITRAIHYALAVGAHAVARELASKGVARFPEHEELQKLAQLLAPPEILSDELPPDPDASMDIQWLKSHGEEYRGRWVALKAGRLLESAVTFNELIRIIGNPKGKGILVTKVY
jgi:hypothetical protein